MAPECIRPFEDTQLRRTQPPQTPLPRVRPAHGGAQASRRSAPLPCQEGKSYPTHVLRVPASLYACTFTIVFLSVFRLPLLLASPPATPPRHRTPEAAHAPTLITPNMKRSHEPSFELLETGMWHRRNPNWVDPAPTQTARPATPSGSLVSTVLVDDDGKTIRAGLDKDDEEEDDGDGASVSESFIGNVAEHMKGRHRRLVSMFATKRTDPARTQQLAAKQGMHAALVRLPNNNGAKNRKKEGSWWMVLGRDPAAVGRVVNESQQRRMPGTMGDSMVMYEGPRLTTFLQLILAGLIGGIVTVCGLSYL
ncbi:hypothetical protein LshimejAT787_0110880 [Lyophyllum shimeji]|uniref:Uncharacterized protein n=1 Tax=Lyophyllum shimeji TaxID=47721 RepID=A0A9P3PEQ1_LYOSH|nr:hypothetical protein LshimejAT787_0110880 [Lyophyllum shimeji]